jgi:hypothetical protein
MTQRRLSCAGSKFVCPWTATIHNFIDFVLTVTTTTNDDDEHDDALPFLSAAKFIEVLVV